MMNLEQLFDLSLKPFSSASGEIVLPCVPALRDLYTIRILNIFRCLGIPISESTAHKLREKVGAELEVGFRASQHSRLVVKYQPASPPQVGSYIEILHTVFSVKDYYEKTIRDVVGTDIPHPEKSIFGKFPHAKVMEVASALGDPDSVKILDIGAGSGRNTIPLARLGYSVDAVELADIFFAQLTAATQKESLPITTIQGDILDSQVKLADKSYQLAILTEIFCHFREIEAVRLALLKTCHAVLPGGFILFDIFVAEDDYQPDTAIRQIAQVLQSFLVTPAELQTLISSLPLETISQESMYECERDRLPPEAWPPSPWFERWSNGRMVFSTGHSPISLYWILCRRTDEN